MKALLETTMAGKRNIDEVLGAISKGHAEAEAALKKPSKKTETKTKLVMGSFLFSPGFLNEVRRLAGTWREEGLAPTLAREGAVLEALGKAALQSPTALSRAKKIAEAGRRGMP